MDTFNVLGMLRNEKLIIPEIRHDEHFYCAALKNVICATLDKLIRPAKMRFSWFRVLLNLYTLLMMMSSHHHKESLKKRGQRHLTHLLVMEITSSYFNLFIIGQFTSFNYLQALVNAYMLMCIHPFLC